MYTHQGEGIHVACCKSNWIPPDPYLLHWVMSGQIRTRYLLYHEEWQPVNLLMWLNYNRVLCMISQAEWWLVIVFILQVECDIAQDKTLSQSAHRYRWAVTIFESCGCCGSLHVG